jgi:hypothetical protein
MSKNNSKRIGSSYERECAKKLSKWLTGSDEELVCWRASHSGSIATTRIKKGLNGSNVSGDFQCLDLKYKDFFDKFFIDSKSLTKINLMMINEKNIKSNKLFQEWKKVGDDSYKNKKIPMMLVKVRDDRSIPDFIILPRCFEFSPMGRMNKIKYRFIISDGLGFLDCNLFLQDDFFKQVDWKNLI